MLRTSCLFLLCLALPWYLVAEEPAIGPDTPVAVVNGQVITLRTLENHLLREEGSDAVLKLVESQLRQARWEALADEATILAMGNWRLPRFALTTQLLNEHGGKVRDQLIQISMVEQALRADGIIIGDLLLQAERERMERRFAQRLEEMGQPQMPFEQFIFQSQGMPIQEFIRQPGFRMLAGLHALVLRRAEVSDETLKKYYDDHRGRFGNPEQVRLRVILLDFEVSDGPDGRPVILSEHRERLRVTAAQLHRQVSSGGANFARQWQLWGRMRDPQAGEGGDVGWVGVDGRRAQLGSRPLPRRLLEEAFRAVEAGRVPSILPLVEYQDGIVLAEVTDHRAALVPPFEQSRQAVRRQYLEANMEAYSQVIMNQIRREAEVEYESLGRIVHHRNEALQALARPGLTGVAEDKE
ncbi:MAG: peptidyl-prolyl cis-trans isomerase [Planctomycetota bacterium]|nr:MAG: peptidyl-prolyl cis-trans isomerase [Planctomycetota bacterium]